MNILQEFLKDKDLPGWLLIHNARLEMISDGSLMVSDASQLYWSHNFDELQKQIPSAKVMATPEAKELASYRFSDDELKNGTFQFNNFPMALADEGNDFDIFGECYTIFWVCEPELEKVCELLMKTFSNKCSGKVLPEHIRWFWNDYLDRIYFRTSGEADPFQLATLQDDIITNIIDAINALPEPPEEEAWNVLNEWFDESEES